MTDCSRKPSLHTNKEYKDSLKNSLEICGWKEMDTDFNIGALLNVEGNSLIINISLENLVTCQHTTYTWGALLNPTGATPTIITLCSLPRESAKALSGLLW